eukprot:1153687-Pelagomonas_calceolata.AAC.4
MFAWGQVQQGCTTCVLEPPACRSVPPVTRACMVCSTAGLDSGEGVPPDNRPTPFDEQIRAPSFLLNQKYNYEARISGVAAFQKNCTKLPPPWQGDQRQAQMQLPWQHFHWNYKVDCILCGSQGKDRLGGGSALPEGPP